MAVVIFSQKIGHDTISKEMICVKHHSLFSGKRKILYSCLLISPQVFFRVKGDGDNFIIKVVSDPSLKVGLVGSV